MPQSSNQRLYAFTILEMSVAIAVIGLLIGGVLAGTSLMRQSQVQSILTDVTKYNSAVDAFKSKYSCLPGDCSNATAYFTSAGGTCSTSTTLSTSTCSGNGNEIINDYSTSALQYHHEALLFWHHMMLSGLLPGMYNGTYVSGGTGNRHVAGTNAPSSRLSGNICTSVYYSADTGASMSSYVATAIPRQHYYLVGNSSVSNTFDLCWGGILSAPEALNLDVKADDGLPYSGTMTTYTNVYSGGYNPCTTISGAVTQANAVYDNTNNNRDCGLVMQSSF